jgi:hypothetical protein
MDRMHNSQGLLGTPIRKFSELFATPSPLTVLQGPIYTQWMVGLCRHRQSSLSSATISEGRGMTIWKGLVHLLGTLIWLPCTIPHPIEESLDGTYL